MKFWKQPHDNEGQHLDSYRSVDRSLTTALVGVLLIGASQVVPADLDSLMPGHKDIPLDERPLPSLTKEQREQMTQKVEKYAGDLAIIWSRHILAMNNKGMGSIVPMADGVHCVASVFSPNGTSGMTTTLICNPSGEPDPRTATHTYFYEGYNQEGTPLSPDSYYYCVDQVTNNNNLHWRVRDKVNSTPENHSSGKAEAIKANQIPSTYFNPANFKAYGWGALESFKALEDKLTRQIQAPTVAPYNPTETKG